MKIKYIITLFVAIVLFTSCEKEKIETYNTLTPDRFLSFSTSEIDVSFFTYPGETTIQYPIIVKSTGYDEVDKEYKISVVADSTTATLSTDYSIPTTFVIKKTFVADTFYVTLNYSDKLDTEKLRLTLKIDNNEYFKEGQVEYRMTDIYFHNNLVKPDWWTTTVTSRYLGTFSELKYKYLLQVIKVDLSDADNSTIRHYALIFKAWLQEQDAAENTILEADGTPMTVPAGGK